MFGIKIQDLQTSDGGNSLSFDLRDILETIGEPARSSRWSCYDLWYTVLRDEEFMEVQEDRLELSGTEMMRLAESIHQTIDGRFEARGNGSADGLWLIIVALDSSWFEVWSIEPNVLEEVRTRFTEISDLPFIAGYPVVGP